jgi:hypothetical protein
MQFRIDLGSRVIGLIAIFFCVTVQMKADTLPPTVPTLLSARAASCGQVDLTWTASTDEIGGSGLKGYTISRDFGGSTTIGASRTSFSDTNYIPSGSTLTYSVSAIDNAGNKSAASNPIAVTTPSCTMGSGEAVIDDAYMEPLGRNMAVYGSRTAVIYIKQNPVNLTWDTWINVSDSGQQSHFLLHSSPGYYQIETDYVLTSATDLWTLSFDSNNSGHLQVNQYKLNGSPATSASLVSTKALGGSNSHGKSLIRLQSGGLMAAWNDESWTFYSSQNLSAGFAYRSPSGVWSVKPVTIQNSTGGTATLTQMILAQHPADNSIWAFFKRDSFHELGALHFTEMAGSNDFTVDWTKPQYITQTADGNNSPETEFPYLAASPDSTRSAILLAYQGYQDQVIYTDPLYGSMNSIFLKQSNPVIAQIAADASKSFIAVPNAMERDSQFGLSVLTDGTIWLGYQSINPQTLTWNQVYGAKYQNGSWSAPVLAGFNYRSYNQASGARDPGLLMYRTDQPVLAFMTPDLKVHSVPLSGSAPPPPTDTIAPTTSVVSPLDGSTVSGSVPVNASASDNVGVTRVDLLVDGAVKGSKNAAPYSFSWDSTTVANGSHTLKTMAYDAAGNVGTSPSIATNVSNGGGGGGSGDATPPSVTIAAPTNGSTVTHNASVAISANATDNDGVNRVEFYVNNTLMGTSSTAPYTYQWKVPGKKSAAYTIKAVAYDAAGNNSSATSNVTAQ